MSILQVDKRYCIWLCRLSVAISASDFVGSLVVAGFTAGFAVHEAVVAHANVIDCLAQAAVLLALALGLKLLALRTTKFSADSATHGNNSSSAHGLS